MPTRRVTACILLFFLALLLPLSAFAAASKADIDAYLEANRALFEKRLEDYNRAHRLAVHASSHWNLRLHDWEVVDRIGERVFVNVSFEVGRRAWTPVLGDALLELTLTNDGPEIVADQPYRESQPTAPSVPLTAATEAATGNHTAADAESYFEDNTRALQRKLSRYNQRTRIAVHRDSQWELKIANWHIEEIKGDRVFATINFDVGRWSPATGAALFELQWQDDELTFVGHGAMPKTVTASGSRVPGHDDENGCTYNYYAARPCVDTVRRWRDFSSFHGLDLTPETAAIFQAYKHNDVATGDRLMARARGLPPPDGKSAFGLQSEVASLKLRRYQRNPKNPCDLNPYGARPCPEILKEYRAFIARHDLPDDQRSAAMLEAYGKEDFRRADVIYALAKGLEVPAYGYIPTGLASEVAELNLGRYQNLANPCDLTPYGTRPCLEVVELWRDFATRYALDDNADNARIFAAYAEGDYQAADQLFAQAKGVSLEQLLEASGVPTRGLVIEVYPGRKQLLQRGITGS